jgi:hypothetical protein
MTAQLPLPASWAIGHLLSSNNDPQERLERLRHDALDTKGEIRAALEKLAQKHRIPARDVNRAIYGYADDMLSDLVYELERELTREIEARDSI